jgi:hypothetical protein
MNGENFTAELLSAVPEYNPDDPDLAHPTLGGLVSFIASERTRAPDRASAILGRVLTFIESQAESADEDVRDLIKVSFLENLHLLGPDCREVVGNLGPASSKLLAEYEAQWGRVCG